MNRPQFTEQKMEVQKKNGPAQGQRVLRDTAATTLGFPSQLLEVSVLAITCNDRNCWQKGESWLGKAGKENSCLVLPGGPVLKNQSSNAKDISSIPGWGTKIPHATGELSQPMTTNEPAHSRVHALQ